MDNYKKEGKIGDSLYMESKDGGTYNAGIVTDIKDGKIYTTDTYGKKHQYSEDNKKIVGFMNFADSEIHDETTTIADTIPETLSISPAASDDEIAEEFIEDVSEVLNELPKTFMGIVNTVKDRLNVRTGAGMNYPVIKTLVKGSKVELYTKMVNGWYELADGSGYVVGNLIKK